MYRLTYSSSYTNYLIIIIRIRIIFILFFLGSSFSQFSPTTDEINYDECGYKNSAKGTISCGSSASGVTLQYPYWSIDEKEKEQRQYYCGYPGLGITCSNGKPMINISNQSYYVIQGNFQLRYSLENRITIVEPDFIEKTCPRPRLNFTTIEQKNSSHFVILPKDSNVDLTFFFNCTSPPPPLTNHSLDHHLECLAYKDTMSSYGFLNVTGSDWKLLAGWNGNYCREQSVVVPVLADTTTTTTGDALKALETGFRVEWNTPIECRRCENSGGYCSYNETEETTYTCRCKKGQLINWDADSCYYHNNNNNNNNNMSPHTWRNNRLHADTSMHNKILIIGVSSGFGGLALIMISLFFIYRNNQRKRLGSIAKNVEIFLESYGYRSLQRYKYKDIKKMTNSFKVKLGQGGYGSVFKGKLVDGRLVAVKVLINDPKKKTNGEDFMNEVATIGRTNHVNIVGLLGFCSAGSKRALVYEFMTNGSLEKFIYAEKEKKKNIITSTSSNEVHPLGLGWEKLYQIAIGIARGLEYLHRGCSTGRILHFDIKPHNILLDENFCPKISDFGLAKLCPTRESIVSMLSGGRGTIGYIAPEVYNRNFGGVSYKSDVYSYGMMVLEMVGGRKNIDPFVENTSEIYFPYWIYNHLEKDQDKIEGLLKFEEALDEEMAKKMIMVGLWCIQTHQECRPSMGRVAEMLEGSIKHLQMPPNPFGDPSLHPPPTS